MEIAALCRAMIAYFQGDTRRIQHFLKVYALAKCIGEREGLSAKALHTLEAAALTHDIAIRDCEREFGHCTGKMQEEFGPAKAVGLLLSLGEARETAERVGVLVACHHTYTETPYTVRLSKRIFSSTPVRIRSLRTPCAKAMHAFSAPKRGRRCCGTSSPPHFQKVRRIHPAPHKNSCCSLRQIPL